ncbi:MAG: MMPL family transporter, partial [Microbacteriaceae bacterium]
MSSLLYSLGKWAYQARKLVLILWVLLLGGAGALAFTMNQGLDNNISIPGTESQEALSGLQQTFPQVSGASARIIIVSPEGTKITDPATVATIDRAVKMLSQVSQVEYVASPFAEEVTGTISDNNRAALISIQMDVGSFEVTPESKDALQAQSDALADVLGEKFQVALGGELFSQNMPAITITEALGVFVALIVLILTFGSLIVAGLPLIGALIGVGISIALIFVATYFDAITSTTPLLALMLGIAVGIDYALFIIARHQDQVKHGMPPTESAARAVATSGSAVIFAGLTVIIALLGLAVVGIPFLTIMGIWAAVAVAFAVLIAITLTPALLGFLGVKVVSRKQRQALAEESLSEPKENRFFARWISTVTKRPILTILAVIIGLGLLAAPALQLRLALPDAGALPPGTPAKVNYDLVAEHFGEGFNGPLIVTGTIVTNNDPLKLMDDLAKEFEKIDGVAAVPMSTPNMTADTGIVQVVPIGAPDSEATKALVAEIRSMHDYFLDTYGVDLAVTGFTAVGIDISAKLASALLPFGLVVVGLSLLLLMIAFRSIWVPIKATLGYLLSIGAALGVVSLVYEYGWFASVLHIPDSGPVISFMPIILMGVLFGLAMDYEVFMVSRMREYYVHEGDARRSVRKGFMGSAKVVTAAAIIMFAVFVFFVPEGDVNIKPIALGFAVGVFVDAFIVRMALVPAVMTLLGDKAWWMPAWLDRILPHFDIEGEGLEAALAGNAKAKHIEAATPKRIRTGLAGILSLVLVALVAGGTSIGIATALPANSAQAPAALAAIVNLDEPVEVNGQLTPLGRQLSAELVKAESGDYRFAITNEAEAASGLASGKYVAAVIVPKNFSAAATSFSDPENEAVKATVELNFAEKSPVLEREMSRLIAERAAALLSSQLSGGYLENVLLGIGTMGEELGKAADGAKQLSDGAKLLADGAAQAADGAGLAASGSKQFAQQLRSYLGGVDQAVAGMNQLDQNAAALPGVASTLSGHTADAAASSQDLAMQLQTLATDLG